MYRLKSACDCVIGNKANIFTRILFVEINLFLSAFAASIILYYDAIKTIHSLVVPSNIVTYEHCHH